MSVNNEVNRINHNPDGVEDTFAYDFRVNDENWLKVYADGDPYNEPFTFFQDVDPNDGGYIVFDTPPAGSITTLTLLREVPATQEVVYPVFGPFPAKTHEGALDKLTWLIQQINEELTRTIRAAIDTPDTVSFTLPLYEAGKALVWDEGEQKLVNSTDTFNNIVTDAEAAQAASEAARDAAQTAQTGSEAAEDGAEVAQAAAEAAAAQAAADTNTTVKKDSTADTGAAELPTGTVAQRPAAPAEGMFRRNSETGQFEGYTGSEWAGVGGASGGGGNPFLYLNDQTVSVDYTMPADQNGMSAGPITIADGVTLTIPDGATYTVV